MDLESLKSDINLLGEMLSQVVRRIEGEEAYRLEEEIRGLAKRLRAAPSVEEARRLRDRLGGLELASLRTLIRTFSVYFDLINLAEQQARVRALRERTADRAAEHAGVPLAETAEAALRKIRERGIDAVEVAEHLERALVCLVFTAHPSEARRR
ncbi:MAG: hypothetical protein JO034_08210, partial [Singulisphaera sp.]|nr:hypothetical protein [Singulisphaera sp.]